MKITIATIALKFNNALKKSFLILAFKILFISILNAQMIPIPEPGAVWENIKMSDWPPYNYEQSYIYLRDTTICGIEYKILLSTSDNEGNFIFYIRTQSDTTLIKYYISCDSSDILLYDFSINVSDTFIYLPIQYNLLVTEYLVVDSIDYITYTDNKNRKIIYLHNIDLPNITITWIEGIGALSSLLNYHICPTPICGSELLCYYNQSGLIYTWEIDTTSCQDSIPVGYSSNNELELNFKIYPNPVKNILTIKIKSINANNIIIKIINIQGKEIFTDIINKYSGYYIRELDVSKFSQGIYTVQVIIGDEKIAKKFIID